MKIAVTSISQNIDLNSGKQQSYLALELPSGRTLQVPVDEQTVIEIIKASKAAESSREVVEVAAPVAHLGDAVHTEPEEPSVEPQPVRANGSRSSAIHWMQLPEEILSTRYKAALAYINAPQVLQGEELRDIVEQITQRFTEEDWRRALMEANLDLLSEPATEPVQQVEAEIAAHQQMAAPAVSKAPVIPVAPAINQISWSDGSPIVRANAPSIRTVPKDDMGNPIVDGPDVQSYLGVPGENADEDGIGQI